jgi:hypothetical protein
MTITVTIETGKYDEDLGYRGSKPKQVGTYKTEEAAIKAANAVTRSTAGVPESEGYTVLVGDVTGKKMVKEILRLHVHGFGMTEEQRQAAKKARLKSQRYEPVKVIGNPTEGEVYYFANGVMVDDKDKVKKKAMKAMLGRVGKEYFAKFYDERPWDAK